jgi:7,8-dihydro-6-hydroxymethylpterin-pyrophosphokinase
MVDEVPWNFCRWIIDMNGKVHMYMNPTVDLHNAYELIEYLCNLDNTVSKNMKEVQAKKKQSWVVDLDLIFSEHKS